MGFLKKSSAPRELPNLAIDGLAANDTIKEAPSTSPVVSSPVAEPVVAEAPAKVSHEDVTKPVHEKMKEVIGEGLLGDVAKRDGFFDEVLEDINDGISDTDNLENWYKEKFMDQDVVSNMKGYWEGNKTDIIIKSFGAEYKRQINDKVKVLRELEEDWREIYFRLVKKEEEMKKEERELKETVSEFVDLCKRRKTDDEEEKAKKE